MFYVYHEDVQEATKVQCTTAYNCAVWGLQNGIKGNLDKSWLIPWTAVPKNWHTDNGLQVQWVLMMISHMIFRYLFAGMIKAIVCGCFGALRAKIAAKANDTSSKCLICSMPRFALDKHGGMYKHVTEHHNP